MSNGPESITELRTTTPLFMAYEETYTKLEGLMPEFHRSEQYFTFLLGKRTVESGEGMKMQAR